MDGRKIIEIKGLYKKFGDFVAVSDLNLSLAEGEFFSLLGPSGCGKTTVLRILAGFQAPTKGRVAIDGQIMDGIPANSRPTNMVFQNYAIFPHLDVGDNVAFGLRRQKLSKQEIQNRVNEALEMVELQGLETRKAGELSGGQRQRVALARALILRPKVLLLDEPLSALDKNLRQAMQFELRKLQRSIGITFVMVTHDQYEAMTMSDRIGVMFNGELAQIDRPEILYAKPCNRDVASFIGGMNFLTATQQTDTNATLTVTAQGFGALHIDKNPGIQEYGRQLLLGIRPEQLEISTFSLKDCDATVKGHITDVAFYGESIHYHVGIEEIKTPVVVAVPNYFHTVDYQIGDVVWLGIKYASVICLGKNQHCQNVTPAGAHL